MSSRPVILIVDDEKNTREGLARALRDEYAVAEAENGLRALEWLETRHADVVLSDLRMPGMDGMGLMIVQRIVRDHGGTVLVDSLPGGTRIQLNFRRDDQRIRLLAAPQGGGEAS